MNILQVPMTSVLRITVNIPPLRSEDDYLVTTSENWCHYEDFSVPLDNLHYPEFPLSLAIEVYERSANFIG